MNRSAQFLHYATRVFDFKPLLRGVRDSRDFPQIPTSVILLTLIMGAALRKGSYHHIAAQTKRPCWQRLTGWNKRISHHTFGYVAERFNLEDLRWVLVRINQRLKANKVLESAKINGLQVVSIDANEHHSSRSRCCERCCQREVEISDKHGQKQTVIEYYHRYVFAHIGGPKLNTLLDLEPILPGQDESAAALRLLGRLRRLYGVRFFDVISADAWYVKGPFLKAVGKLGWEAVVVLKQQRMEVFDEATRLSKGQEPSETFHDPDRKREVQLWEVKGLEFTRSYGQPVRVVRSTEQWVERKRIGDKTIATAMSSNWVWMTSPGLGKYGCKATYHLGHRRWKIENKGFNELTQFYHLEHCYHHEPVAMLAQMLILMIGFVLFMAFALLRGKLVNWGRMTMKELAETLDRDLEEALDWSQWFVSG